jgi:alkane 1-monooxygenase
MVPALWLGGAWVWLTPAFVFVVVPLLDVPFGLETKDPDPAVVGSGRTGLHQVWLVSWVLVQLGLMAWTFARVADPGASGLERLGWVVSLGVVNGACGITIAHELMHRRSRWEFRLSELLMALVAYPHFCVEHVFGHHKHVATPHDPATARWGQSVFSFLPQTLIGSFRSFWSIERDRRRGWRDARFWYPAYVAGIAAVIGATFGPWGLGAYFGQATVAVFLLEVINYVEHYGLERSKRSDGRYERVQPEHSWNSAHRLTSALLFELPRHSDHHHVASRPYPLLRHHEGSPQLPAGYATMVLAALLPPLWRRVMDPRVAAARRAAAVKADDSGGLRSGA